MNYQPVIWAEIKPDIYGGESGDEVVPQWVVCSEGDMGSETFDHPLDIDCKLLPPGTKVVVSVPCCPKCQQRLEMCMVDEGCDFDWVEWIENEYS